MRRTDYSVTMCIFIYIRFQTSNPRGSLYSSGQDTSPYTVWSQMVAEDLTRSTGGQCPRGHGHEQASKQAWAISLSFISDPHEMDYHRPCPRFEQFLDNGRQWFDMAFYGEYSVRVTHYFTYFTLSTETHILTGHMAKSKQSAKTQGQARVSGAGWWVMTIDCHAGTGWLPRGRQIDMGQSCFVLFWFWMKLMRVPYLDFNYWRRETIDSANWT